jgi:hypothetical protein
VVRREHQPLAAEHGVEGAVGLVDPVEVEHERAHGQAARPPRGDRGHLRRHVGEHDLVAALGRRDAEPAGPARQLEHAVARPQDGQQLLGSAPPRSPR